MKHQWECKPHQLYQLFGDIGLLPCGGGGGWRARYHQIIGIIGVACIPIDVSLIFIGKIGVACIPIDISPKLLEIIGVACISMGMGPSFKGYTFIAKSLGISDRSRGWPETRSPMRDHMRTLRHAHAHPHGSQAPGQEGWGQRGAVFLLLQQGQGGPFEVLKKVIYIYICV